MTITSHPKQLLLLICSISIACITHAETSNNPLGGLLGALSNTVQAISQAHTAGDNGLSVNGANPSSADPLTGISDADKQLMSQGMWHDPRTGLIWMRCALGESWTGSTCLKAQYNSMDWDTAAEKVSQLQFGGYHDWRLPTIEDLNGIFDTRSCMQGQSISPDHAEQIPKNGGQGQINVPQTCVGMNDAAHINNTIFPITDLVDYDGLLILSSSYSCHSRFENPDYDRENGFHSTWIMSLKSGAGSVFRCTHARQKEDEKNGFVLVVRSGQSTGEFEHALAVAAKNKAIMQQRQEIAAQQTANLQAMNRRDAALRAQRQAAFRQSVHAGDQSAQGLVLEVQGNLVKVQTINRSCSSYYNNGSCANWNSEPVEQWIQRNAIFPANGR